MNHHPELQDRAAQSGSVIFTPRGEAALDELAAVIAARCSHTPAGHRSCTGRGDAYPPGRPHRRTQRYRCCSGAAFTWETAPGDEYLLTRLGWPYRSEESVIRGDGRRPQARPSEEQFASVANPPDRFMMADSTRF